MHWFSLIALLGALQSSGSNSELTVQQIFERCAKAHLSGKTEIQVEDFTLGFRILVNDAEKKIELEAQHQFRKPYLVKTTVDDKELGVKVKTGFDGKLYWLFDEKRGTVKLTSREHEKDIREIDERIRLSQILAKTFSIKRFMDDLKSPKRIEDIQTPQGKRIAVQAKAVDFILISSTTINPETDLILYFDPETYLLREIFASPPPSNTPGKEKDLIDKSEKFVLEDHKDQKGLLIPQHVKIFVGKETKKPHYDIQIGSFDFNTGLKDEDFKSPSK